MHNWPAPECLVIGEGGKVWAQARVLGGMLIAGESACVELQVKNHSAKKVRAVPPPAHFVFFLPTGLCIDDGDIHYPRPALASAFAGSRIR